MSDTKVGECFHETVDDTLYCNKIDVKRCFRCGDVLSVKIDEFEFISKKYIRDIIDKK